MGLLKIFTRRSSKAKLKGHDTQSQLETPSQGQSSLFLFSLVSGEDCLLTGHIEQKHASMSQTFQ